jgi:hypothetical protein
MAKKTRNEFFLLTFCDVGTDAGIEYWDEIEDEGPVEQVSVGGYTVTAQRTRHVQDAQHGNNPPGRSYDTFSVFLDIDGLSERLAYVTERSSEAGEIIAKIFERGTKTMKRRAAEGIIAIVLKEVHPVTLFKTALELGKRKGRAEMADRVRRALDAS